MMQNRFFRQLGLVDQERLQSLNVLVSGSNEGIADLIVLFQQLGIAGGKGRIGILCEHHKAPTSVFWKLAFPKSATFSELVTTSENKYVVVDCADSDEWDIHLSLNGSSEHAANLYGRSWGPRALISNEPIAKGQFEHESHPLTPSLRIACASALVETMLTYIGAKNEISVSDAWFTVTCRIETTDTSMAAEYVAGMNGIPMSYQPTSDGLATLARVRVPYPMPGNPYQFINIKKEHQQKQVDLHHNVGLIDWNSMPTELDGLTSVLPVDAVMLGVGGLGSWAAPLLAQQMPSGTLHIVDGDLSIEQHNLNRQVLYNETHVGQAKATVAEQQLKELNANITIVAHEEHLLPGHLNVEEDDESDELIFDLDEDGPGSYLTDALTSSSLYFGCLDNMRARTLLNEAALNFKATMINGGSESVHAIVERLNASEGCMVCRYGRDSAYESEVISCTEEGARPIASIATTTAWAGAMMAALGLIEASELTEQSAPRLQWHKGAVERIQVNSKPPWFNEPCLRHI